MTNEDVQTPKMSDSCFGIRSFRKFCNFVFFQFCYGSLRFYFKNLMSQLYKKHEIIFDSFYTELPKLIEFDIIFTDNDTKI